MKKKFYLGLIILLLILPGCKKKNEETELANEIKQEIDVIEDNVVEEIYIDDNPTKIAFYSGSNGVYKRLDKYESHPEFMKEIGVFSIILSDEKEVYGSSIKSLYKEKIEDNPLYQNYKIGFNIKFTLKDGTVINENILRPILYANYGFCHYLYAWIYDDVNANGWHSHIEEDEFTDDTIMSSIKLMWGKTYDEIDSDIELTVFTYDDDDFDEQGNYRGKSKYTTIIERS